MKTIGLLGGMSWESSIEYYRIINETVRRSLGGSHSAKSVLYSVDFQVIETMQHDGDWRAATAAMVDAAQAIERAGADCLVICTNTMHRVAEDVQVSIEIPLIHIADATASAVASAGVSDVGLLGTRFTMEHDFYRGRLEDQHGLTVLVPDEPDRTTAHDIIYDELVLGTVTESSRQAFIDIVDRLVERGAQGVISGCTEIELLIKQEDVPAPFFPTTRLHAEAAVEWALAD